MSLQLGQILYTAFDNVGFKLLNSQQVSIEKQNFFMEHIAHKYWDSYAPSESDQKAIYLNQLNSQATLFGWLFNDGSDDMGREDIPYFIAYCLESEITTTQLELIFDILEKGPLFLIERHKIPDYLPNVLIPEPHIYQSARQGIKVSPGKREFCSNLLERGERLNLYVQVNSVRQSILQQPCIPTVQVSNQKLRVIETQPEAFDRNVLLNNRNIARVTSLLRKSLLRTDTAADSDACLSSKCFQEQSLQHIEAPLDDLNSNRKSSKRLQPNYDLFSTLLIKVNQLDKSVACVDHLVKTIQGLSVKTNERIIDVAIEEGHSTAKTQMSNQLIAEIIHSFSRQIRHSVADIESTMQTIQAETHQINDDIEKEQHRFLAKVKFSQKI